ncbi:hypothetical protein, partial [Pseudomonas viridiflava]|uniref:hypothetical protein n=1 Tax=Pseudomonas viridiflava TaxID=33069 RepID=UPI00198264A4
LYRVPETRKSNGLNTVKNVGAGLSGRRIAAMAVYQLENRVQIYRYRRQASSHIRSVAAAPCG